MMHYTHAVGTLSAMTMIVLIAAGCGGAQSGGESSESADPAAEALLQGFPGTWELTSIELKDSSGNMMPEPDPPAFGSAGAIGQLVADREGHIGLAIMQQGRPKYEDASLEQAVADIGGYTAWFGTYTMAPASGLVTVQIQGSRDPRLTGTSQTSILSLDGDSLSMELPLSASGIQPTFHWRRLPDITDLTDTHERVFGFWHHVPNEGDTTGDPPLRPGFIIYSPAGRMMVHLMDPVRAGYAGAEPTPEEAQATVNSYTSYFGPFSVDEDGSFFVHHRIGHTLDLTDQPKPDRRTGLDTDAQRFFEFVDNRMVLRFLSTAGILPAPEEGEAEWGGTITWERLSTEGAAW